MGGPADLLGRYKPVTPQEIRQAYAPIRHSYSAQTIPAAAKAAVAVAEKPRKRILLTPACPQNFLDACALCKKRIPQNKQVQYKHGYLNKA